MTRKLLALCIAVVMLLTLVPASLAEEETVYIGFINPLTTGESFYGELQLKGATLAIEEINANGGVLGGKQLELVVFDDQSIATSTVAGAQKFVDDPRVVAVHGANNSGCTLAMLPLLQEARMLNVNASSSAMALMDYDNFFRTLNDSAAQTAFTAQWCMEDFGKTTAIVAVNNDWGADMAKGYIAAYEELGGEIVATEYTDASQSDYRSVITRIKALKPEVVYLPIEGKSLATFAQQATELGLNCTMMASTALMNAEVLAAAGYDLDNFKFITEFYVYDTDEVVVDFVEKYGARFDGELPGQQAANTYEAIYVIYYAIEKAGSLEREEIMKAAYEIEPFQGITGTIQFGGDNGHTLMAKDYTKMEIVDGDFALYTK